MSNKDKAVDLIFEEGAGEMEMELELDGDEILDEEMEKVISEKVKKEEKENKKNKSKRGPKKNTSNKKEKGKKTKKKEPNYKDKHFIEREIKKGRISAPCYRIEKAEKGYDLLEAKGVIFPGDAKYEKYDNTQKMVDGKWMVALKAAEANKSDVFNARHEDGVDIEHDFVRVELHKPGREKDVIELYSVAWAKRTQEEKIKREEERKAKAEKKKAKEKEEKAESK